MITDKAQLASEVDRYTWYHTLDFGDGIVTKGMFDHRPVLDRFHLPADLSGARCLDVGTMDGYWAFEMERRGASEVVAIDLEDPDQLDWPVLVKPRVVKTLDETKSARFELARSQFDSKVTRLMRSVYELDTDLGTFDVVFCGDLLVHLKDPISAIEALRRVTKRQAIICTPTLRTTFWRKGPLVAFDGIDEFQWWTPNAEALQRWVRAAGFDRTEMGPEFEVPLARGGKWAGLRGVVSGFVDGS